MKILIALDDTPRSSCVVDRIAQMRWPAGSRAIVVTVVDRSTSAAARGTTRGQRAATGHESAVKRGRDRLRVAGICAEHRVVLGDPRDQLIAMLESERADLVVLGTSDRSQAIQYLSGSVSSHLVTHARCSVFVVRATQAASAMGSRSEGRSGVKLLLGIDDSPHSRAATDFTRKMVWPKGSEVLVTSVLQPLAPLYLDVYSPMPALLALEDERLAATSRLAESTAQGLHGPELDAKPRVVTGDPRIALVDLASAERADLIVVGSHGRTGISRLVMGSVAHHIVTHASCSVLVVKLRA